VIVPSWVKDPYSPEFLDSTFQPSEYVPVPKIGFCGQAHRSVSQLLKIAASVNVHNLKASSTGFEKHKQFYSPFHRKKILDKFRKSNLLECDFIEREKYRAGLVRDKKQERTEADKTTIEYYRNIFENPYSIAIRGGGNFSIRFFDTCAMGRIPIFINYDSPLPFKDELIKRHLIVELDLSLKGFDEQILAYHKQFETQESFGQKQSEIRYFSKEYYTKLGFYKQIYNRFNKSTLAVL